MCQYEVPNFPILTSGINQFLTLVTSHCYGTLQVTYTTHSANSHKTARNLFHSPRLLSCLLLGWKAKGMEKRQRKVWRMVPLCLFWCIWKEGTQRIFCEEEISKQRLKETLLKSLMEWYHDAMGMEIATMLDFLDSLNCE